MQKNVQEMNFTREEQDNFAVESYNRSNNSWKSGKFSNEIVHVEVPQKKVIQSLLLKMKNTKMLN